MKQIFALIILILFAFLTACGGNSENQAKQEKQPDAANSSDISADAAEKTTEPRIYPDLAPQDFGGHEFTFLVAAKSWVDWTEDHRDIFAESINGDIINDAVFNRNKKIEEKYNIKISQVVKVDDAFSSTIRKAVKAGDDMYDAVSPLLNEFGALAQEGNLVDLFKMPVIDLANPWWNQGSVRDLSLMHKSFIVQGDLLTVDNDAMEVMIFNKNLLKENALETPYDIVQRGEWTFEKLLEMCKGISKDLNGDGKMYIKDDLFGCITQADTTNSFIVSGGEKIAAKDENDLPVITFGAERCYRILEIMSELLLDENITVNLHRYVNQFPVYEEQTKMFSEDRALFSWIRMEVVERLRGMETDFGIIPCPKLDKAQEKYITHNNPWTGAGLSVPTAASDLERTGMILEDLCAESKYVLQPAYYEINLKGKYVRDDESQAMLDIILNNTAYDIGYIYNFGNFGMTILYYPKDFKDNYASAFDKMERAMEKDIEKMIKAYEKLD